MILIVLLALVLHFCLLKREMYLSTTEKAELKTKTHDLENAVQLLNALSSSLDGSNHVISSLNCFAETQKTEAETLKNEVAILRQELAAKDLEIVQLKAWQDLPEEEKVFN